MFIYAQFNITFMDLPKQQRRYLLFPIRSLILPQENGLKSVKVTVIINWEILLFVQNLKVKKSGKAIRQLQ